VRNIYIQPLLPDQNIGFSEFGENFLWLETFLTQELPPFIIARKFNMPADRFPGGRSMAPIMPSAITTYPVILVDLALTSIVAPNRAYHGESTSLSGIGKPAEPSSFAQVA